MAANMGRVLGPSWTWADCPADEREVIAAQLRAEGLLRGATLEVVEAASAPMPFAPAGELLDLTIGDDEHTVRGFVARLGDRLWWLDGTSTPVHDLNEAASVQLAEPEVLDYVRWFLFAVRGDEGSFVLLDTPDAVADSGAGEDRVDELRESLAEFAVVDRADDVFCVDASMAYAGAMFTCRLQVDAAGNVEMLDDTPVGDLDGVLALEYPDLPPPTALVWWTAADPASMTGVEVTTRFVGVLLAAATRERLGDTVLRRFNTETGGDGWSGQLRRFAAESAPMIVIESDIPFVEEVVADLLDPAGELFPREARESSRATAGSDTASEVNSRYPGTRLHLLSFYSYRSLFDIERTAHDLAIGAATVLIGCERLADVPQPLRRVTDLVLTLPRIDPASFVAIFEAVFEVPPPADWAEADGGGWVRHLLHTDFHALVGEWATPAEAVAYLRERCTARLQQVSPHGSVSLHELHGMGEARHVAQDLIDDIAAASAGAIPWTDVDRGLLLVGAPGTGKTTLARAIAKDCGINFIQASAAQWQSAGALDAHLTAIRQTFSDARHYAPSILFIDEIDSIGNRELLTGSNAVYQTDVINAVLEQIQGMDPANPVIVIAATNFVDRVDPALRRAGRLDQVVTIERPNVPGLTDIFRMRLAPLREAGSLAPDVDEVTLAKLAFGATGADVEQFVRGATRRARKQHRQVAQEDLVAEVTRRPRHDESAVSLPPDSLRRVAVHEAGHALVSLLGPGGGAELTYVSVIPRLNGTLGFVASAPRDDPTMTRRQCIAQIEIALGGRAAEEVCFGADDVGLGAGGDPSSDLAIATQLATLLVCAAGLGADGGLRWTEQPTEANLEQIDALLREAYTRTRAALEEHRSTLDRIADLLVARQEVDGDALRALVAAG